MKPQDTGFQKNLKLIAKQAKKVAESLHRKHVAFSKIMAPRGWGEGLNVGRSKKSDYPLLVLYWVLCLIMSLALFAVAIMALPYAFMVDPLKAKILMAVLGFFSVVSLSSILVPLGLTIMALLALRIAKFLTWKIEAKSVVSHLSNYVGIAGVVGFLSAAMAPLVFAVGGSVNVLSSSIMFDGSVLLKFPAAFGVVGLLLGLCATSCHIVGGIDNIIYKNVVPVLLFDILVAGFAFKGKIDPFSLCINLSEKYLRNNSYFVAQMDSISGAEFDGFVRDHLPLVVAKFFSMSGLGSFSVRVWYVVVVVLISIIGMCVSVWKAVQVKCGNEKSIIVSSLGGGVNGMCGDSGCYLVKNEEEITKGHELLDRDAGPLGERL